MGSGEVENELKMRRSNKATGWDGISPKILKLTAKGLGTSLTKEREIGQTCGRWWNGPLFSRREIKPTYNITVVILI